MKKFLNGLLVFLFAIFPVLSGVSFADNGQAEALIKRYAAEVQPFGGVMTGSHYKTIQYTYRSVEEYKNPYKLPSYLSSYASSCAIDAGAAVIANYDITYEELIPDYAVTIKWGVIMYQSAPQVTNMFARLYSLMGTNADGTTVPGYTSGLTKYVNERGRNISITPAVSNGKLNYAQYKAALESGKLVTVFVNGFNFTTEGGFEQSANSDRVLFNTYAARHTYTAYGYKTIRYYDAGYNLIDEDFYLHVKTGIDTVSFALFLTDELCTVEDGFIIGIY